MIFQLPKIQFKFIVQSEDCCNNNHQKTPNRLDKNIFKYIKYL